MNELTVEHLAPYLPYELRLLYEETDSVGKVIYSREGIMMRIYHDADSPPDTRVSIDSSEFFGYSEHIWMFKPILRPLSDLPLYYDVICYNVMGGENDTHYSSTKYDVDMVMKNGVEKDTDYGLVSWMFKNHFDVFKLIDKGLAVNINTLNNL